MDNQPLSQAAAVILSTFVPYVWHGNLPAVEDKAPWEAAASLWQALRPSLDDSAGAGAGLAHPLERPRSRAGILKAAVEQPTEYSLAQLARTLADLFDADSGLATQVEAVVVNSPFAPVLAAMRDDPSPQNLLRQTEKLELQIRALRGRPAASAGGTSIAAPRCQVCGRSDSSLRVVGYPYVVSALFVTFRRTFAGLWCGRHAAWYRTLASLLTVGTGWWGIPFGLFFTPVALFTLARGGNQPPEVNQRMLMDLAQHKLKNESDPREALRCLEAALTFGKTPALEARLRELYAINPDAGQGGGLPKLVAYPALLAAAALIGLGVGILDYLIGRVFGLMGEKVPLFIAVLSWVPIVAMLFGLNVFVSQLVDAVLTRTRTSQRLLGAAVAILTSLVAIYAVPSGEMTAITLFGASASQTFSSALTGVIRLALSLVWGGVYLIESNFTSGSGDYTGILFAALLLGMGALYIITTVSAAGTVSARLRMSSDLRAAASAPSSPGSLTGWLALIGCAVVVAGLFPAVQLVSDFQYGSPATLSDLKKGMSSLDAGDYEGARTIFDQARTREPGSFLPYVGLGFVELGEGNCEQSLKDIQTAGKLGPGQFQSSADMYSGEAYACMSRLDDAIAAYEKSVAADPSSREAFSRLGLLYLATGDFDRADSTMAKSTAVDKQWAVPYVGQAIIYYETGQPDKEQAALRNALSQKLDEQSEFNMLAGYYAYIRDLPKAESYLRQALAKAPNNADTMNRLSNILAEERKFDEAMSLTDRVLAGKSDPVQALIARSDVLIQQENLDEALQQTKRAETLRPDDAYVHSEEAWIYFYQKDYEKALSESTLDLAGYKYDPSTYTVRALAYQALGRQEDARAAAEQALKLQPRRDLPHYVPGVYNMNKGAKAEARTEFQAFLDLTMDRAYVRDMAASAKLYLAALATP